MFLGNFLSGMETRGHPRFSLRFRPSLETSLVEWKLPWLRAEFSDDASLETSLVEWKHTRRGEPRLLPHTLETSLVEWKLGAFQCSHTSTSLLGNFLSGMETGYWLQHVYM